LGIETLGSVMTALIPRNTTIPTKKSQVFSTAADNQTAVTIHVLQGERPMAQDNKSLGRFDLVGIPSAPRGIPQIEVTFDIDANGILHVSAKDKGTGKEQSIKIDRAGNLNQDDIDRMIKDAEMHAEDDKKRQEFITAKNELDSLIFSTDKSLSEYGEKLSPAEKSEIEAAVKEAKEAFEKATEKTQLDEIKETLAKKAQKLGEIIYANMQQQQGAEGQGFDPNAAGFNPEDFANAGQQQEQQKTGDGPIDADYEVVDDK
jgi:molecular chaperone DnaK